MNKIDLIQKLKQLEGLTTEERSKLIELVNTNKKYGLVWEDKPEDVEELLRQNLPVLREVKDKYIAAKPMPVSEDLFSETEKDNTEQIAPNHILIEGDNLHALTALSFTHKGKIDVIYIDPPYNTGNKDFKYNDSFVDKEDSYRHSKWLSFINKRLRIAHELLNDNGVIFISIGNDEYAQLKILLDEIFQPLNFISNSVRQAVNGGTRSKSVIAQNHDYVIVYAKNKLNAKFQGRTVEGKILELSDEKGPYTKGRELNKWGAGSRREDSPTMWFSIPGPDGSDVFPIRNDGSEGRWRWGKKKMMRAIIDKDILFETRTNGSYIAYQKERNEGEREIAYNSLIVDSKFSNASGTEELKDIFNGQSPFSYPKPIALINLTIKINDSDHAIILDFFAGSGSTLHATMMLNAEDGGNRQCILVTNNENNICEEITYERNKRVIQGYSNSKGVAVSGLTNNNLRYYKSEFVPSTKNEGNRRLLTNASTELLCIRENCFTDVTKNTGFKNKE